MQILRERIVDAAVSCLIAEMNLGHYRLIKTNAFNKTKEDFVQAEWDMCLSLFSLGYLHNFVSLRLEENESDVFQPIYEKAQKEYFSRLNSAEAKQTLNACWELLKADESNETYFDIGKVASEYKHGIYKHLKAMLMLRFKLDMD